jgi:hypothetical protein
LSLSEKNIDGIKHPTATPNILAYAPTDVDIILSYFGNQFAETLGDAL